MISETPRIDIHPDHWEIVRRILQTHVPQAVVWVFGSRATGRYHTASDIDLVLYGPVPQDVIDRLYTVFEESPLPFRVDILGYNLITHAGLRGHIDEVGVRFLGELQTNLMRSTK
jgi:type I restriction enzyme S subunit